MREYGDLRDGAVGAIGRLTDAGQDIIVMVADSTSTSKIGAFMKSYPDRVVNVGIAEQNMVGMAAGLALGGHTVFTANAAPFLVGRANEQVKNDICYSATNVKMLGLNAGVAYGPLASTHHAIDDISVMSGFGNVQIFAPRLILILASSYPCINIRRGFNRRPPSKTAFCTNSRIDSTAMRLATSPPRCPPIPSATI